MLSPSQRAAKRTIERLRARQDDKQALRPIDYAGLRILTKRNTIEPLRLKRAQDDLLTNLTGRDLVLKARQIGISTAIQAHMYLAAIQGSERVAVLAHDSEGTQKLRDMMLMFHEQLPAHMQPPRSQNNVTRTYYPASGSRVYMNTAGSAHGGRAGTYTKVHGSEVAYWKDAGAIMAGLLQGVPVDGEIILESTANGQSGWFYERCMEALRGEGVWKLHFFPWWYDDDYTLPTPPLDLTDEETRLVEAHGLTFGQIAFRRSKQSELGMLFPQEYPEDPVSAFVASGQGYFTLGADVFTAPPDARYTDGHRYVAGLDFAQSTDFTVLTIVDVNTLQQVEVLRINRMSWASMRAEIVRACARWHVDVVVAESNSMGGTNIEALYGELEAAGLQATVYPFTTTHASKAAIMADLKLALGEGGLKLLPDPVQRHELAAFEARQTVTGAWTLSAPDGMHDDTVIALALAWHAVRNSGGLILFSG